MFVIRIYRWTLKQLHTALVKAQEAKEKSIDSDQAAIAELKARVEETSTESLELAIQARAMKKLLG